jgi:hypothetical protein
VTFGCLVGCHVSVQRDQPGTSRQAAVAPPSPAGTSFISYSLGLAKPRPR